MKEARTQSECLVKFEVKMKEFHKALAMDEETESLIPAFHLNQTFVTPKSVQPKFKKIEVPKFYGNNSLC